MGTGLTDSSSTTARAHGSTAGDSTVTQARKSVFATAGQVATRVLIARIVYNEAVPEKADKDVILIVPGPALRHGDPSDRQGCG